MGVGIVQIAFTPWYQSTVSLTIKYLIFLMTFHIFGWSAKISPQPKIIWQKCHSWHSWPIPNLYPLFFPKPTPGNAHLHFSKKGPASYARPLFRVHKSGTFCHFYRDAHRPGLRLTTWNVGMWQEHRSNMPGTLIIVIVIRKVGLKSFVCGKKLGNNQSYATDWCCKGPSRPFPAWIWKVIRVKKSSRNFHALLKNWIAQNRASVAAGTRKGFSGLRMILCNSNNSALSTKICAHFE